MSEWSLAYKPGSNSLIQPNSFPDAQYGNSQPGWFDRLLHMVLCKFPIHKNLLRVQLTQTGVNKFWFSLKFTVEK